MTLSVTRFRSEEYQDHYTTLSSKSIQLPSSVHLHLIHVLVYRVANETVTLDDFLRGDKEVQKEVMRTNHGSRWSLTFHANSSSQSGKLALRRRGCLPMPSMLASRYAISCANTPTTLTIYQIRPTEAELKEMGPDFNKLWDTYFKDKPDKPVMYVSVLSLKP